MTVARYVRRPGDIGEISLRRPERHNAIDAALVDDLLEALAASARDGVRALVLTGAGPSFCSGHDIGSSAAFDADETRRHVERLQDVSRVLRAGVPSVAAVRGYALGAGCELALSCDFVVAAQDAVFGMPEVPMGLAIGGGASAALVHTVGPQRARELVLLGDRFDAARALDLGLVAEVVAPAALDERATALAAALASRPPQALAAAKAVLHAVVEDALERAYERETEAMLAASDSDEAAAAAAAFRHDHRAPHDPSDPPSDVRTGELLP